MLFRNPNPKPVPWHSISYEVWSADSSQLRSKISKHKTEQEAKDKILTLAHTLNHFYVVVRVTRRWKL